MKPTVAQAVELYRICQQLTQMYVPIYVVRIDERTGNLVIIAGEETKRGNLP